MNPCLLPTGSSLPCSYSREGLPHQVNLSREEDGGSQREGEGTGTEKVPWTSTEARVKDLGALGELVRMEKMGLNPM